VNTFSNPISTPPFVGLYGLSDWIWFLKIEEERIDIFNLFNLFIYLFNYSTDPFEPSRVNGFSKSFETYHNVGLYGLSDWIWFLKVD